MKIFVKKTISGLVPCSRTEFDKLQEAKLKLGEFYEVEIKKKRNILFHRKYFALINICFDNQEIFESADELRYYIIMKAGFVKPIKTPTGIMYMPISINFASMDEIEFEKLYSASIDVVISLIGCTKEDLINEILSSF